MKSTLTATERARITRSCNTKRHKLACAKAHAYLNYSVWGEKASDLQEDFLWRDIFECGFDYGVKYQKSLANIKPIKSRK